MSEKDKGRKEEFDELLWNLIRCSSSDGYHITMEEHNGCNTYRWLHENETYYTFTISKKVLNKENEHISYRKPPTALD